jgi:hypothetical protein
VSLPSALFLTAYHKSLGETYTAARFAEDLRRRGWRVEFLAFEFGAAFLRRQGLAVTLLGSGREENRRRLGERLGESAPDLILTSDHFLFESREVRQFWDPGWLFATGIPVATFDHMRFHPEGCSLQMAFIHRLLLAPEHLPILENVPAGARPRPECDIAPLPGEIAAVIRPCPIHDPRPEPGGAGHGFAVHKYDVTGARFDDAHGGSLSRARARERFGAAAGEKLVLVPVGSWALQVSRAVDIPYEEIFLHLLVDYLEEPPEPVRVLLLSGEIGAWRESRGRLTIQQLDPLPFDELRTLMRGCDLVLCDNATSTTLGRAVMEGVPAAVLVNSVEVDRRGPRPRFAAPFRLTPGVESRLRAAERRAPGSIFPFSVYPLGWRDELRPAFTGNPYASTLEWLELFDEPGTRGGLKRLLFDAAVRRRLGERQAAYRRRVARLPEAAETAARIVSAGSARNAHPPIHQTRERGVTACI